MASLIKKILVGEEVELSLGLKRAIYCSWGIIIAFLLILGINHGGFLPGYSEVEIETAKISAGLPSIIDNFLYYPYHFLVYLGRFLIADGVLVARLISWLAALTASFTFFYLLRRYFSILLSLVGASFFILNSWILQLAKTGTPEMFALASALGLVVGFLAIKKKLSSNLAKAALICLIVLNLFMPLMPWLILALIVFILLKKKKFKPLFDLPTVLIFSSIFLIMIGLIGAYMFNDPKSSLALWGISLSNFSLSSFLSQFFSSLQSIVWQAPFNPDVWLADLGFLDIFTAAMLPFGIYGLWRRKESSYILVGLLCLLLFGALSEGILTPGLFLILPLAVFLATMGLVTFLRYWRQYFPFNPLARALEVIVLTIFIGLSIFYQMNKHFVAYRKNPLSQEIYNLPKEDQN